MIIRKNSFAFGGGAFGDEGKGRIVDLYVSRLAKKGQVIVYRDNGGANAGHTVEFKDGQRVALHQLPSGIFIKGATVVLGKGMVLHPGDLLAEIKEVKRISGGKIPAKIMIDEMAVLSLDTHRAFEAALQNWQSGSKGATGRGISPAYADVLLRHPLRARDLAAWRLSALKQHYQLYQALLRGLGEDLAKMKVLTMNGKLVSVGSQQQFVNNLKQSLKVIKPLVKNVYPFLETAWKNKKVSFVFEKAQGVGLDARWGVYPDVTASDTTFAGIFAATEGIINPEEIELRAAVIKATYMSSVGIRRLPSVMTGRLADKIREDAHEYGATTKRPRGITYLDLPALHYFTKVGRANALVLTHMDIVYPKTPIKICVGYKSKGKTVGYRPDQEYLDQVKPVYKLLPTWDQKAIRMARKTKKLPKNARQFLKFVSQELNLPILAITTGPKRNQGLPIKMKEL
ncbi:hypothetical protein A2160_05265 [Candidatus Beckwithbacteria bacterium RBG_13_42_9]|uniref:Adenylosuccinate synthetase n=1 Tax=Candidatus Beckwithbacteria bacterium RBG_13_42_9 TaxID=1797457 RepID=A0A1F5E6U5_9BACT|nr:MAG: hypothetical protein A2160_05265 [Candidatus Beckwithbacteria bacterium RBG_13_42_9]